ncbi:MAG: response regulator [Chloroflexi bacterium]|nr:response regulator [Chloroflexota bacterium]
MTKGTVLVVDDDPDIVDLLTDVLELDGYRVQAALGSLIQPLARVLQPDVILLDIMMPGKDGVTVAQQLRADPRTATIPVIAVSASVHLYVRAAEMGADACLSKPFDLDDVLQYVARWAGQPDPPTTPPASSRPVPTGGAREEWDKRPTPRAVSNQFIGDMSVDGLIDAVTTLRADPNWVITYAPNSLVSTLDLTYWPTGEKLRIVFERAGQLWRPSVMTGPLSYDRALA